MWRVLLLSTLLGLIALGAVAYGDCTNCVTSVFLQRPGSGNTVTLSFTAQAEPGISLPPEALAVVMQVDGQRTKCQNVALLAKTGRRLENVAVYSGSMYVYGNYTHSGRVELSGRVYEFTVPIDGTPGKIALAADQTPLPRNGIFTRVTAAPVTPAPTAAPVRSGPELPRIEPAFLIGATVVLVTIVGAYVDRRRALARNVAG